MILGCGHDERKHTSSYSRYPAETFVYRLYDASDRLLYIGSSGNLQRRMWQHKTEKPWWSEVARIEAMKFDYRCHARAQEAVELQDRVPEYTRAEHGWTRSKAAS